MLGEDPVSVAKRIAMFEDRGYEVHLHCTELDKNKSLGRALERFYRTGRYHDWNHLIQSDPVAIANTYELLKGDESIAGYSKWNTDVPFGEHPIALEYSDESESNLFGGNLQRDASGLRTQAWDAGNGNAAAVGDNLGIGRGGLNTENTEGTVNEDGAFSDGVKYSLPQDAPFQAQCIPEYWLNLLRKGSSSHAGQAASPYRNIQLRLIIGNMKELECQSSLSSRAQEGFGLSDGFTSAFTAAISAS